jgi:beta-aspartyl-peptidase (threonine type)
MRPAVKSTTPESSRRWVGGLALVLLALLLAVVPGVRSRAQGHRPGALKRPGEEPAEKAIRDVLQQQVAAWNRGDLEEFMKGYWHSDELTFFSAGNQTKGWQATLDRYRKRYQSEGQEMGKLTFSELRVELLGPDTAFVRGRWQLQRSKDRPGGLFTLIFRRFPEGWRIVHDHTSS